MAEQILNELRKAEVVALLKPGKYPESQKSYRPIALLCSLYKLLVRMILTRLQCKIEHKLITQQAGFIQGKSCCSQVLNLTHHIEDILNLARSPVLQAFIATSGSLRSRHPERVWRPKRRQYVFVFMGDGYVTCTSQCRLRSLRANPL